jgi:hypothetical protein
MRLKISRSALLATASLAMAGLLVGGCAKDDMPARTHAILTDREAVRLAELHLDDTDADAVPRDVVSIEQSHEGRGHIVGFHSFFDETERAPKQSRLVMVDHDGDVRELTFKD